MKDGGPAFPFVFTQIQPPKVVGGQPQQITTVVPGMTKRDWFAGMALANVDRDVCHEASDWADAAYALADAMIAELERKPDDGTNDRPG